MATNGAAVTALRAIGWWTTAQHFSKLPAPQELVGDLSLHTRAALTQHLREGLMLERYRGYSWCRFSCGIADSNMGSGDLTDGTWVWPEGLAHYVEVHNVVLPQEFIDHVLAGASFTMPVESEPYDDEYWIKWCSRHRSRHIKDGINDAVTRADTEFSTSKATRMEALERERGLSNERCIWAQCSRLALVGTRICAQHHIDQTEGALASRNRHMALRAYLKQMPVSPDKVR